MKEELQAGASEGVLFWGQSSDPAVDLLEGLLEQSPHVWHAGLLQGMAGKPSAIDAVFPTWMYNRDAEPDLESTSWRLTLDACLVRTEVLDALGFVDPRFATLAGASLELGHRWLANGAIVRHVPSIARTGVADAAREQTVPTEDELRFVHRRFGPKWAVWAAWRMWRWGATDVTALSAALLKVLRERVRPGVLGSSLVSSLRAPNDPPARVTVLIPTLDRYPWLEVVLDQLRRQTVAPYEVIVVDQTAPARRRADLVASYNDLPIKLIQLDRPGQSSARNAALAASTGDAVLLLDDDVEVPEDLIERHLRRLIPHDVAASCGVAIEPGEPWDADNGPMRASTVFPGGNTLVRRSALGKSGLFDVAYDRGVRADGDLGMRLYLSGALVVLDPSIKVLHHRAPAGGLREHGMRKTTHRGSRTSNVERNTLAATEVYLARRYFTPRQVQEMVALRRLSTFSRRGHPLQRVVRALVQFVLLPDTDRRIARARRAATELLAKYPEIPMLSDG